MLKKLRIQNFKGWQDTASIRMAPILLFFGANSSGKSSIGQFLMMLKQTVESPDRKAVFYPGGKNSAVQLGSYQEMVFHRDPKKKLTSNTTGPYCLLPNLKIQILIYLMLIIKLDLMRRSGWEIRINTHWWWINSSMNLKKMTLRVFLSVWKGRRIRSLNTK